MISRSINRMRSRATAGRRGAGLIIAFALLVAGTLPVASASASSTGVVISEFQLRGTGALADEFVELYNASTATVPISGWKLAGSNSSGFASARVTIPDNTNLLPGCHYLLATNTYDGPTSRDVGYNTAITDDGGVALLLPGNSVVDAAGMSAGSAYKEGTILPVLGTDVDRSYERKPGGALGNGQDTDDNASDFALRNPSAPQNLASACVDQPPTATGDTATVTEDDPAASIDVLANDPNTDGGPKSISSVTQPANGTVSITGGGSGLDYQPEADYCNDGSPPDDFAYVLNGGSTAVVSVTVTCVVDPPPPSPPPVPPPPLPTPTADTTRPETKITGHPRPFIALGRSKEKTQVRFDFASTEAGSTFECRIGKEDFKPCASPRSYSLAVGLNRFRVVAIDAAGNRDRSAAQYKVRVKASG